MSIATLSIGGTDVESIACLANLDDFFSGPTSRGPDVQYPGIDGSVYTDKPYGADIRSLHASIGGSCGSGPTDPTNAQSSLRALLRLFQRDTTLSIQRQVPYSTGTETHETTISVGASQVSWLSAKVANVVIPCTFHDGCWYDLNSVSATGLSGTGSVAVSGDLRSERITLTLAAGAARTISNDTNGWQLTYSQTVTTPVVVDVQAGTATAGGVDVSQYLSWVKRLPFRLDPGTQQITVSAGTADLTYYPAYI